ncbi:relaxase/mobilization nuclease domain-containing protein [Lactococcus garvieae]|uniref:relaxase/mobilization nuclease domain-containing protein n=1 Tax=Lactococcus garvieae TaxID=1363 RepID=UPI0037C92F69
MATTHIKRSTSASRLVNYAEKRAVLKDGYNIDVDYAKSCFKQVREIYGNAGKTEAYASRVAFSPQEFNPQSQLDQIKALEIAKEIYATAYPHQQVALYVHNDTESLHVHAVIGAIDLQTGKKMHGSWQDYREKLVKITDKVVEKHGLSVTIPQLRAEKRTMAELKMKDKGQVPWKDKIRQAVDATMREAHISDFKSFKDKLERFYVNVYERGRELTYELLDTNKKVRGAKLGDDYKKETIFNELDRRKQLQYERSRERQGSTWLKGRGERVKEEQSARQRLAKRAEKLQREAHTRTPKHSQSRNTIPEKSKDRGFGGPRL